MPRPFEVPDMILTRSGARLRPTAPPRPTAPHHAFLVVGLIFALIAGILAMHTMATSMGDHLQGEASASMTMTEQSAAQFPHHFATTPGSTGATPSRVKNDPNPMGHAMTLMVCILALLFAALATATTTAEGRIAGRRVWAVSGRCSVADRETWPSRAPPDLNQLSISRV